MKRDYAPESHNESLGVSRESHDYYAMRARRWRNRVGLAVLVVLLLFWAYTLFTTPFFSVQSITVFGLHRIQPQEIQNRVTAFLQQRQWGIVPRGNIFLLRLDSVISHFKNDARIATIHAQKKYRERSLVVTIEERVPLYILALPDRAFAIDKEGIALVPLALPPPRDTLPIIVDTRQREVSLGQRAIAESEMDFFTTIRDPLTRLVPFTDVHIGEPSPDAVTFVTDDGFSIYFNLTDTAEAQLNRFKVLLTTKIKPERRKRLQYIDLRFGERVYYK